MEWSRAFKPTEQPAGEAQPAGTDPLNERIPDELVDAFFDGDIAPERRVEAIRLIRSDAEAGARLDATSNILSMLHQDRSSSPDLSSSILSRIEQRRPLVAPGVIGRITRVRSIAALLAMTFIAGLFVGQRAAPEALAPRAQPVLLQPVVQSLPERSAGVAASVQQALEPISNLVPASLSRAEQAVDVPGSAQPPADMFRSPQALAGSRGGFDARGQSQESPWQSLSGVSEWVPPMNPPIAAALWSSSTDAGGAGDAAAPRVAGFTGSASRVRTITLFGVADGRVKSVTSVRTVLHPQDPSESDGSKTVFSSFQR